MQPKHTPGPWSWKGLELVQLDGDRTVLAVIKDAGALVLRESDLNAAGNQIDADRRLIAAAPDLLTVVQQTLKEHQNYKNRFIGDWWVPNYLLHQMQAAATKATGGAA
jgi:hypothetical protein